MCGIAGIWTKVADDLSLSLLKRMTSAMQARGPDDEGQWVDPESGIGLGHRRLSIVDLSPAGHQPMVSASGRFVIVFNGEIYNHLELRAQLEGQGQAPVWRGHSDTETWLACFEAWGVEATLKRSVGMFALGLWDRERRCLALARDRMGEKPLYYGKQGDRFYFASDLSALRAHPTFESTVDRNSLTLLLRHNYIPAPYSIYKGIGKLPPATFVEIGPDGAMGRPVAYWSVEGAMANGVDNPFTGTPTEAVQELEILLKEAIRGQMMADVPLGAFLSGGIDSSTVVALMQSMSSRPIKTFSIGFHEERYNEAQHAGAVAKHLGTDHCEWYVTPADALAVIPKIPEIYSEPFSDSSQIPTFLVSQLARRHVTVSLSGDGGDELFGGYDRYDWIVAYWSKITFLPRPLRKVLAATLRALPVEQWNRIGRPWLRLMPRRHRNRNVGGILWRVADSLAMRDMQPVYERGVSHWPEPGKIVLGGAEPMTRLKAEWRGPDVETLSRIMALDQVSYLPDDILCKLDRAAMAVSLESRVPMLDHRVVEFAWRLAPGVKVRGGVTKWPVRELLNRHVPPSLTERPKMGFAVPIDLWLKGPLRDWAEDLLDEGRMKQEGYFDPAPIRQKWTEHQTSTPGWAHHLWDILMFQAWLRVGIGGGY